MNSVQILNGHLLYANDCSKHWRKSKERKRGLQGALDKAGLGGIRSTKVAGAKGKDMNLGQTSYLMISHKIMGHLLGAR